MIMWKAVSRSASICTPTGLFAITLPDPMCVLGTGADLEDAHLTIGESRTAGRDAEAVGTDLQHSS